MTQVAIGESRLTIPDGGVMTIFYCGKDQIYVYVRDGHHKLHTSVYISDKYDFERKVKTEVAK